MCNWFWDSLRKVSFVFVRLCLYLKSFSYFFWFKEGDEEGKPNPLRHGTKGATFNTYIHCTYKVPMKTNEWNRFVCVASVFFLAAWVTLLLIYIDSKREKKIVHFRVFKILFAFTQSESPPLDDCPIMVTHVNGVNAIQFLYYVLFMYFIDDFFFHLSF